MFSTDLRNKPILKWAGGKSALIEQMAQYFPTDFNRYIEPFFGGGALYFSLEKLVPAILNDINSELTQCYTVVKDQPQELMSALDDLHQNYSEEFYYKLRAAIPECKIARAARTIFLNKTGFNGLYRQNAKGLFNVPFGKRQKCPALYDKKNLLEVSSRLSKAQFLNTDFSEIIEMAKDGDFVYCDPPYEPISSTSSFNRYFTDGFTFNDQKRLFDSCVLAAGRGATVAVSNSCSPAILELYKGHTINFVKARRNINSKARARGEIDEVLIVLKN